MALRTFLARDPTVLDDAYRAYYRLDGAPLADILGRSAAGRDVAQTFREEPDSLQHLHALMLSDVAAVDGMQDIASPPRLVVSGPPRRRQVASKPRPRQAQTMPPLKSQQR